MDKRILNHIKKDVIPMMIKLFTDNKIDYAIIGSRMYYKLFKSYGITYNEFYKVKGKTIVDSDWDIVINIKDVERASTILANHINNYISSVQTAPGVDLDSNGIAIQQNPVKDKILAIKLNEHFGNIIRMCTQRSQDEINIRNSECFVDFIIKTDEEMKNITTPIIPAKQSDTLIVRRDRDFDSVESRGEKIIIDSIIYAHPIYTLSTINNNISSIENSIQFFKTRINIFNDKLQNSDDSDKSKILENIEIWKNKYKYLSSKCNMLKINKSFLKLVFDPETWSHSLVKSQCINNIPCKKTKLLADIMIYMEINKMIKYPSKMNKNKIQSD